MGPAHTTPRCVRPGSPCADTQCTADVVGRLCVAMHNDATVEDVSACHAGQALQRRRMRMSGLRGRLGPGARRG